MATSAAYPVEHVGPYAVPIVAVSQHAGMIAAMPLMDYFSAASDSQAARVTPGNGGPTRLGFDVLDLKGIDPTVMLTVLESILTGRPEDEVAEDARQSHPVVESASALVVTVTDTLRDALATADERALRDAAAEWSTMEELEGSDPENLADALKLLADLSRRAIARDHRLYCWWSL